MTIHRFAHPFCGFSLLILLLPAPSGAQPVTDTFEQLGSVMRTGDRIFVTDQAGRITEGTLAGLTASSLALLVNGSQRQWGQSEVLEVRRPDALSNGMQIGAWIGLGMGLAGALALGPLFDNERSDDGLRAFLVMGTLGTGIGVVAGAGIDAALNGRILLFRRPSPSVGSLHLQPVISRSARGLRVAWRF
jgi:hypothetical protein